MPEVHTAAVALGSNLPSEFGPPQQNLQEAVRRIGALGRVTRVSRQLTTAPQLYLDQPEFVNAALLLETELQPIAVLRELLAIETAMGRVRAGVPPKGPRLIDLDLILFDALVMDSTELTLPHPAFAERSFVLMPLAEIAPDLLDPRSGLTIAQLLGRLLSVD